MIVIGLVEFKFAIQKKISVKRNPNYFYQTACNKAIIQQANDVCGPVSYYINQYIFCYEILVWLHLQYIMVSHE